MRNFILLLCIGLLICLDVKAAVTATEIQECKDEVNKDYANWKYKWNGVMVTPDAYTVNSYNAAIDRCDQGYAIVFRYQSTYYEPDNITIRSRLIAENLFKYDAWGWSELPTAYKLTFDKNLSGTNESLIKNCLQPATSANNYQRDFESHDTTCGGIPLAYTTTTQYVNGTMVNYTYSFLLGYSYPDNYSATIPIYKCRDTSNRGWDVASYTYYPITDTWLTHVSNCGNGWHNTTYPGVTNLGVYAWGFPVASANYQ